MEICQMMHKGAMLHKRLMTRILERYDLTFAQYQVMKTISEHPGTSAKEILVYMDTDKATLSGVLYRLEQRGMIVRKKDPEDRRLVHIHLSEESQMICSEVTHLEKACEEDLLKGMRSKELKFFLEGFNHVLNNQIKKLEQENENT